MAFEQLKTLIDLEEALVPARTTEVSLQKIMDDLLIFKKDCIHMFDLLDGDWIDALEERDSKFGTESRKMSQEISDMISELTEKIVTLHKEFKRQR